MPTPPERIVSTAQAPRAIGPYSQGVAVASGAAATRLLFLSGQIPLDPETGQLVQGTVQEEARRVLENLAAVLRAGGAGFQHVVKTTVFLTDLADFAAVNEVYGACFPQDPPARSTVQVAALPRGARVEIEAVAAVEAAHGSE
jgi:2-iminobutanoate/2-iminopropanoate deaminase